MGQTDAIRKHLESEHSPLYRELVLTNKLKGWERFASSRSQSQPSGCAKEEFTLEGFYERLVRWIAVDDQVISVIF
jgi:hypothetical protein